MAKLSAVNVSRTEMREPRSLLDLDSDSDSSSEDDSIKAVIGTGNSKRTPGGHYDFDAISNMFGGLGVSKSPQKSAPRPQVTTSKGAPKREASGNNAPKTVFDLSAVPKGPKFVGKKDFRRMSKESEKPSNGDLPNGRNESPRKPSNGPAADKPRSDQSNRTKSNGQTDHALVKAPVPLAKSQSAVPSEPKLQPMEPPAEPPASPKKAQGPAFADHSFFKRIQDAQKKQASQQLVPTPQTPIRDPISSPVRHFNAGTGSLLDLHTPKSMQWNKPISLTAMKASTAVPINIGEDANLDITKLQSPTKWGDSGPTSLRPAIRRRGSSTPLKAVPKGDHGKDLLSSILTKDDDSTDPSVSSKVEGLAVELLPHQTKGLAFLISREEREGSPSGLLCDDMGLGKTVQSIALILKRPAPKDGKYYGTLVIAPKSLLFQWAKEIEEKAPGLRVLVHHGTGKAKDTKTLRKYDVVLATYMEISLGKGPLGSVEWWRIIADEAQMMKNASNATSMKMCELKARSRWSVTGTPIENGVNDLYSQFRFLQITPFNDPAHWKKHVTKPMSSKYGNEAIIRLKTVLSGVMIRRSKKILEDTGRPLPSRTVHVEKLPMSSIEQKTYSLRRTIAQNLWYHARQTRQRDLSYLSSLKLLLEMRQVCDDLRLLGSVDDGELAQLVSDSRKQQTDPDDLAEMMAEMKVSSGEPEEVPVALDEKSFVSTKTKRLLSILKADPSRKTIVFSQFTKMLDLLEPTLREAGIRFCRYDGKMTAVKRDASIQQLKNDDETTVMLCSIKCASVGLNLTFASQVVLYDPWWNPMVSEQAIDRVHRMGQTRSVDVYELIVQDSVEEMILRLQDGKRQLAAAVVDGHGEAGSASTLNKYEIMRLLGINDRAIARADA